MPIVVVCPGGHKLAAKEEMAGKYIKCPKCGSVLRIPKADAPQADDEPVHDETLEQPQAETYRIQQSESAGEPQTDWWDAAEEPVLEEPSDSGAAKSASRDRRSAKTRPGKQHTASEPDRKLMLAVVGGGSVVGLLLLGLLAWFLFGESAEEPPVVAERTPASPTDVSQDAIPGPALQPEDEPEPQNAVADATPAESEPTARAREPQPLSLTRIELDNRLLGYELPGTTWAAAYDEVTGRLAMTNDEEGVVIYDLDDLLSGKLAPVATLPTDGLPTAVCLKVLADRRAFVIAGQDEPTLQLVNADTLEQFGEITLEGLKFVDFLAGSPNPEDPFVYYSTQQYRGTITADSDREDNKTADRLGRVDLVSRKQDDHTAQRFVDVVLSPDGERLYARPNSTANGVTGAWSELLGYSGDAIRSRITSWPRNYSASPVQSLGEAVAVNNSVYDRSMRVLTARLDYAPGAAFRDRPLLVGLSKTEIVFGSANDYRRSVSRRAGGGWI